MKEPLYHHILKKIIPYKLRLLLNPFYYSILENLFLNKKIQSIITSTLKDKKPILVFLPLLEWNFYFQRPQHFLVELSKRGFTCIFCTPFFSHNNFGFKEVQENIYLCNNVLYLKNLTNPIIYLISPNCYRYLKLFQKKFVFYDYVDDLNIFGEDITRLEKLHHRLIRQANIVASVSQKLYEELKKDRPDALLVSNGVTLSDFKPPYKKPKDMENVFLNKKPIVGFYGSFGKWLDYDLINYLTDVCRDLNFVFLGDGPFLSKIKRSENVFTLDHKDYFELKNYLSYFDICFIPFKNNSLANAASPVKLFEFFSLGKPVVTLDIPSWKQYTGILTSKTYEEFVQNLYKALTLAKNKRFIALCKNIAQDNTWSKKIDVLVENFQKKKAPL